MLFLKKLLFGFALVGFTITAVAQQYPDRPIRLIVPYSTGGGTDLMARILAQELTPLLGQPIMVDNKPGAGAVIGSDIVAKARPDGYTILLTSSGHTINPSLYSKLPFDAVKSFTPIIQIATGPNVIVVNHDVPAKSISELVAMMRKAPGKYSFGSAGIGNPTHLAGEVFQSATNTRLIHVPYKGSGQAEIGLAGGEITMIVDSIPAALPFINSGKTRALAVTGDQRFPLLPNVPTAAEAGLLDYDMTTWWGLLAPAGTPEPVVMLLNTSFTRVLQDPEVRKKFLQFGATPAPGMPAPFAAFIKAEAERFAKLIQSLGIQPAN